MRNWLARLALCVPVLIAACASEPTTRDINDPANALVFGYIDMSEAPTGVSHAWLEQIEPPTPYLQSPYRTMHVKDGILYAGDLAVGTYKLNSIWGGNNSYGFGPEGGGTRVRVAKPGIYYLGSFKYRKVKTGLLEGGKFGIERINEPSEAALLKKLLGKDSKLNGTVWAGKIRARLAQLPR